MRLLIGFSSQHGGEEVVGLIPSYNRPSGDDSPCLCGFIWVLQFPPPSGIMQVRSTVATCRRGSCSEKFSLDFIRPENLVCHSLSVLSGAFCSVKVSFQGCEERRPSRHSIIKPRLLECSDGWPSGIFHYPHKDLWGSASSWSCLLPRTSPRHCPVWADGQLWDLWDRASPRSLSSYKPVSDLTALHFTVMCIHASIDFIFHRTPIRPSDVSRRNCWWNVSYHEYSWLSVWQMWLTYKR